MQAQGLPEVHHIVQFVLEIDKLKGVLRKVKPVGEDRYENTAEHSWQIAILALSLARTLQLSMNADLVVCHAACPRYRGDRRRRQARHCSGWKARKAAELGAVERIFSLAPETLATFLLDMWKEFDAGETQDARFAKAIDRSMPVLLNLSNHGGSWLENGITYERVCARVGPEIEAGCPELWNYMKRQLETASQKGFFAETQG